MTGTTETHLAAAARATEILASLPDPIGGARAGAVTVVRSIVRRAVDQLHTPGKEAIYAAKLREADALVMNPADDPTQRTPAGPKYPMMEAMIGIDVPNTNNLRADITAAAHLVRQRVSEQQRALATIEAWSALQINRIREATTPAAVSAIVVEIEQQGVR
jgi:hypothetical protein